MRSCVSSRTSAAVHRRTGHGKQHSRQARRLSGFAGGRAGHVGRAREQHAGCLRLVAQSLDEAIRTMDQSDSAHWIFLNKDNDRVTVIYRKPDKTFGVVESIT